MFFKNSSLFFDSSLWLLIAGLPLLGYQLKKVRKIDYAIVETSLKGLNLENTAQSGTYFGEKINSYKKRPDFIFSALPMFCLCGLILAWSRVILKASDIPSAEHTQTLTFISCCFAAFAVYLFIFASAPYRKLRKTYVR